MSAWIVSKAHIDVLVGAGGNTVTSATTSAIGRMLWRENYKSVAYRYPNDEDGDLPGPIGLTLADVDDYVFEPRRERSIVEIFVAIDCYVYQSCEHPGWEASAAAKFCDTLRRSLISTLPGYDEAPWGIDDV